ncbi:MAG: hypothetical protein KBT44_03250 [Bacteroidales bacterium]|nr:hypothetical protein [Candidatus Equibacterium intestinale]
MKRISFILTLIVAAILCSCSKFSIAQGEDSASISISVSMDDGLTKATADGDGAAANVNRCILQIWNGDNLYKTIVMTAPSGTREYSFIDVNLNPEETYDFLFWADCGTADGGDLYYSTESLKSVRLLQPERGNDDAADAFCNCVLGCRVEAGYKTRLILRRPLAQLNIIARDLPAIAEMTFAEEFAPKSVSYSVSGCTCFDVREGKAMGEPVHITVNGALLYGESVADGSRTLAMTYVFPQSGESVSAVDIEVKSANGAVIATSCENVPLKANFRTNIIGSLMTAKGEFSVFLSPMFDGEINAW